MGWTTDYTALGLRNEALSALEAASSQDSYAQDRIRTITGVTRMAMGSGHEVGDRLVQDSEQISACVRQAHSSIFRAMSETRAVSNTKWVPE